MFSLDLETRGEIVLHLFQFNGKDSYWPLAGLIDVKNTLYGTTPEGGVYGDGTVFSIDPGTGHERVRHSFSSYRDDAVDPVAELVEVNGVLYGTTISGPGNFPAGTVFSLNPKTRTESVVYVFCSHQNCADGYEPRAGLINIKWILYGTTYDGGGNGEGFGTVFSINPATGLETVLHAFDENGTDGYWPVAGLIDVKGSLYGTTPYGGDYNLGTVFSFDPTTGTEEVLHSFQDNGADGFEPAAGLIDFKGDLYGTTMFGGTNSAGTVFSIDPETGTEAVLHSFGSGSDGQFPEAGLIDVNGKLYGTTLNGGVDNCRSFNSKIGCGTVFSIVP